MEAKTSQIEFFKKSTNYLGHVVSENGVETDPMKRAAIRDWPTPITVTDMRSFVSFTNF